MNSQESVGFVAPTNGDGQIMRSQGSIPNGGDDRAQRAPAIRIAETFSSLQGEGMLTGTRSFFIRTSGCNLRCWFCDTPYASWQPEGATVDVGQLVDRAVASGCDHVVLTGGEPMLPMQSEELVARLRGEGLHVTIETAGTIFRPLVADLLSISPKLRGSGPRVGNPRDGNPRDGNPRDGNPRVGNPRVGNPRVGNPRDGNPRDGNTRWHVRHEQTRWRPDVIARLIALAVDYQVKFVIDDEADFDQCVAAASQLSIAADHVWIMPQGIDERSLDRQATWLRPKADSQGFRYCDRMHVRWYGNQRGT